MKILLIIQKPQLRGAEIFASQLGEHLRRNKHDVVLVALQPGEADLPFSGRITRLNRPPEKRLMDARGWRQLARVVNDFRPDIVQANAGDTLKFSVFSKLVFRWKAPIVFRNANKVSDFISSPLRKWFNRFLVRRVQHVISVSEICRKDFVATYGVPDEMTTMIPIGVEPVRQDWPVPPDLAGLFRTRTVIVHVAGFAPEKNHEGMLRIAKSLCAADPSILVLLVGDGKQRPAIERNINQMNLAKSVRLTGFRPDVAAIVGNARALVLPSKIEGLPGVLLEAMYLGTPVVAYDVGGISEIVRPGETGWLVPAGDEHAFALAVEQAIGKADSEGITARARLMVDKSFRNAVIAERFLEVYERVRSNQKPDQP